jgi:hypothetical protein
MRSPIILFLCSLTLIFGYKVINVMDMNEKDRKVVREQQIQAELWPVTASNMTDTPKFLKSGQIFWQITSYYLEADEKCSGEVTSTTGTQLSYCYSQTTSSFQKACEKTSDGFLVYQYTFDKPGCQGTYQTQTFTASSKCNTDPWSSIHFSEMCMTTTDTDYYNTLDGLTHVTSYDTDCSNGATFSTTYSVCKPGSYKSYNSFKESCSKDKETFTKKWYTSSDCSGSVAETVDESIQIRECENSGVTYNTAYCTPL